MTVQNKTTHPVCDYACVCDDNNDAASGVVEDGRLIGIEEEVVRGRLMIAC